ncbi:MAG TPA: ROK family protein [Puia sp.]|jgi:predicted NBD/HSP70 family sugar kinase|nr:ROK family protein [Puia sp.]
MVAAKSSDKASGIFKELYYNGSMSCLDLSKRIKKSLPNTSLQLTEMVAKAAVVENGYAPSTGGRKPLMYSLAGDFMFTLAVAVDQFVVRIVLMDMQRQIVSPVHEAVINFYEDTQYVKDLADEIENYVSASGVNKNQIAGIGIAMPGFIDPDNGINYSINGSAAIVSVVSERVGIKVYIDNDSSVIGLAEQKFGAAGRTKNVMVINIGWGVGLGMILDGQMFRGANGFAGEFSHIPMFSNNKLCSCGKHGCLETESSLSVIVEKAKDRLRKGDLSSLTIKEMENENIERSFRLVKDAALKGDKLAIELFSEAGYNIGRGVAILVHLLNPELIVLSGRGASAGKIWEAPIQQALNEHCIPRLSENTKIMVSKLGHQAELLGAAALVMEGFDENDIDTYAGSYRRKLTV